MSGANRVVSLQLGREQNFDLGWHFCRGTGDAFQNIDYDDTGWRYVNLPHDWSIEDVPGGRAGPFDPQAVGGAATGFTVGGDGWYRRNFTTENLDEDATVEIVFDGAYLHTDVWLNGTLVKSHVHGYTAFACDLSPYLKRGEHNVIAVHVSNLGRNSRWYSGSGLYRSVTLNVLELPSRIKHLGVSTWTRRIENGTAEIDVSTQLSKCAEADELTSRFFDPSGTIVAEDTVLAKDQTFQTLAVTEAQLWSPDHPELYRLETELRRGSQVLDKMNHTIGIRIITFDAQQGMSINGTHTELRGGCIHHDNGLLGACAFSDADERRVRKLRERGYNAIRIAHNPSSRTLREACDRLGMLIIEEAFDVWHIGKEPQDFAVSFKTHWREVIEDCVLSARNNASVIMWSIGNEIAERSTAEGIEWQWQLANAVRHIDPTRPVTAGINGVLGPAMTASENAARLGFAGEPDHASTIFLDVLGYNYRLLEIEGEQAANPRRIIYASETFAGDAWDYALLVKRAPYFLGEFVWTAMDYLGEAGIGRSVTGLDGERFIGGMTASFPWVNAWCGDIDLIGNQKAASRYRDVIWGRSILEIAVQRPVEEGKVEHVAPWGWSDEIQSWTWPGSEEQELAVRIYSSADRVELNLNGECIAARDLAPENKMRTEFRVAYSPGTLEAVAFSNRKEIERVHLVTVGPLSELRLSVENSSASNSRHRLYYINFELLDSSGRILPDAKEDVSLIVDGPAELIGFGSADPWAVGSYQSSTAQTFQGRALAILRSLDQKGAVSVKATAAGISSNQLVLDQI